ncbi:MAG TPA: urea amidolyase associated protein UAAP1 [Polyangiaceae bacterium]|jgi:urea carboxylase-associated protein 2|nr:urea amidolyase associated protein UAAP1 [Polyangiaceae bacterium]
MRAEKSKGAAARVVFEDELPAGGKWSHVLKRHQVLCLTDVEGGANVSALFFNGDLLSERYNMPDTLKAQYTAFLTAGRVLLSDRGRALCSIVEDTLGWHDTLCGHCHAAFVESRYGSRRYHEARNEYYRNAHDAFLMELGKWGLGKQDIVPNVNFFSKVAVDDEGVMRLVRSHSKPGHSVSLRAEMNVLVVLASSPHPLDLGRTYAPKRVSLIVRRGEPAAATDACRMSRPEATRAFENTERYFA